MSTFVLTCGLFILNGSDFHLSFTAFFTLNGQLKRIRAQLLEVCLVRLLGINNDGHKIQVVVKSGRRSREVLCISCTVEPFYCD